MCECRPAEETGHVIQCQSQPYDVKCLVSGVGTFPLVARLQGGGGEMHALLCANGSSVTSHTRKKTSGCLFSKFTSLHF